MVNKPFIVSTFVLQTLNRNITHSAIINRNTTLKNENLQCGGGGGVAENSRSMGIVICF